MAHTHPNNVHNTEQSMTSSLSLFVESLLRCVKREISFWIRRRVKLATLEDNNVQEEDKVNGYQLHDKSSGTGLEMAPSKGSEAVVVV
jgi:hypothetical protein